jgi:hypothetical protein
MMSFAEGVEQRLELRVSRALLVEAGQVFLQPFLAHDDERAE